MAKRRSQREERMGSGFVMRVCHAESDSVVKFAQVNAVDVFVDDKGDYAQPVCAASQASLLCPLRFASLIGLTR
jgi:hypothetical protein